jgi:hypothetical protein
MNPSCNLVEGVGFQSFGDPSFTSDWKAIALAELLAAGLPRGSSIVTTKEVEVYKPDSEAATLAACGIILPDACARSETMWIETHEVTAKAYGWHFRRAWYYWVCATDDCPVPAAVATELHVQHGRSVRTYGYAGGRAPDGEIYSYHVDTPAGFKILVDLLKLEHDKRRAKREADWARRLAR